MVFFKDKAGTPYSISNPEDFLSSRSIQRRSNQGISVIEQDIPVVEEYVSGVRNVSPTVKVLYRTKWMNGILVECMPSDATAINALGFVNAVESVAPGLSPAGKTRTSSAKFKGSTGIAAATDIQLAMIGLDDMHNDGFHGEGILIAVLDAGFPGADTISYFRHIFDEGRFDAATSYNFVSGGSDVFKHNSHGTHVWSIIGGYKPSVFTGGAYKANFMVFVTEHTADEYRVEEYNWLFAMERADSAGADVVNTSLGYNTFSDGSMNYSKSQMDGQTAVITRAANIAASKGIAIVVSAGNEGSNSWGIITAPADSENVFTVGSVDVNGNRVSSSSIGPTADARIKPDVVSLGNPVSYVAPNGSISSGSGTSYASPLIASLVAGVWQRLPELSVKQVFDRIRSQSSQATSPDNQLGYGIPNFIDIILDADSEILARELKVFPNPVGEDQVRINVCDEQPANPVTISVFDGSGRKLNAHVKRVSASNFILDTSDLSPGLYLIRCQQGKSSQTRKILKVD